MWRAVLLGLSTGALGACTVSPRADVFGIEMTDGGGPLQLVSSVPPKDGTAAGLAAPITLTFNGFPDPESVGRFGAVSLLSGQNSFDFVAAVDLPTRSVVLQPRTPLTPNTGYVVQITVMLEGLDGARAVSDTVPFNSGATPGGAPPGPPHRTLATDVQPLFTAGCAVALCHDARSRSGDLGLGEAQSLAELVGVDALEKPRLKRVAPGAPQASYLLRKLVGTPDIQPVQMPNGSVWPDENIRKVSDWIATGAAP